MMIGFSTNKSPKNVLRITARINAKHAPAAKTKKFEYLKNFEFSASELFHEYTEITQIIEIKEPSQN